MTQGPEPIAALAAQLKDTIERIDQRAARLVREVIFLRRLALVAVIVAIASAAFAVWVLSK